MRELRGVSWPKYGRMPESECGSFESCLEELKIKTENRRRLGGKTNMGLAAVVDSDGSQDENLNSTGSRTGTGTGLAAPAGKGKRIPILSRHKRQPKKKAGKDPFRERPSLTQLQQEKSKHTSTTTKRAIMYEQFEDDKPLLDWSLLTSRKAMQERRGNLKVG